MSQIAEHWAQKELPHISRGFITPFSVSLLSMTKNHLASKELSHMHTKT